MTENNKNTDKQLDYSLDLMLRQVILAMEQHQCRSERNGTNLSYRLFRLHVMQAQEHARRALRELCVLNDWEIPNGMFHTNGG